MKTTSFALRTLAIPFAFLAATLAPDSIAQTAVTTDPVGFINLNVKGTGGTKASEITYIGLSMARPVDYQGTAETVSGSTLTSSTATWTTNQFASTPTPGYFLEVFSGSKAGLLTQIVSCNGTNKTLTVAENLTSLGVESTNVTFKIRQNWSLAGIFGATNSAGLGAGNSTTADLVSIYNPALGGGAGGYDQYFYSSGGLAGVGWRKVGGGNTNHANTPIAQDEGPIIKRLQASDLSIPLSASVKLGQTLTTVFPGPNFIGNVYPSGVLTLGLTDLAANPPKYRSNLYTASSTTGVVGGNSTTADLILIYNPTLGGGAGGYDQYFYSSGGLAGIGWRKVGGGSTNQAGTVLASGKAIYLKRSATAGNFNWVIPQPFATP